MCKYNFTTIFNAKIWPEEFSEGACIFTVSEFGSKQITVMSLQEIAGGRLEFFVLLCCCSTFWH